jgi:hypothetical protein
MCYNARQTGFVSRERHLDRRRPADLHSRTGASRRCCVPEPLAFQRFSSFLKRQNSSRICATLALKLRQNNGGSAHSLDGPLRPPCDPLVRQERFARLRMIGNDNGQCRTVSPEGRGVPRQGEAGDRRY